MTDAEFRELVRLVKAEVLDEISGLKINQLPAAGGIADNHLFVVADVTSGVGYKATLGQLRTAFSTVPKTVELTIGQPLAAKPAGSPTPADGATEAILNFKVSPDSELITYRGFPVFLAPSGDFNYTPDYTGATTKYTFSLPMLAGDVLKFKFSISA